ncbi:MAG: alanine racemase [Clostridia bacterium]|nr:alanine racemase [Clostridia bacterium]
MKNEITRPTIMEINIDNFKYNLSQIKSKLKPETIIMPIMKANAYGTYINTRLDVINDFGIIGLATVDEGVNLRKVGYKKEIFILNQPAISEINKIIENNLVIGLSSNEFLDEVQRQNVKLRVHLEIETGMGRTGIVLEQIQSFIEQVQKTKNIQIEGIYTHLSSPDIDDKYTNEQLNIFEQAVDIVKKQTKDIKYIHILASNGIINYPKAQYNLVRPGMIMYGYKSAEDTLENINLRPVATLKSKITFLKTVENGTSISYARDFITKRKSKIATVPIGYADGFRRNLSNNGKILINGQKVPIIGKVCMDSFMADVTDLENVKVGDDVFIWDNEKITLEEIAHSNNTINYEILSTISNRVPRKFV